MTKNQQIRLLTRALLFYAKGNYMVGFDGWEAPDEPNWMCPPPEPPEDWDQMMLEDGGVAAAALREVYGRALTRYDYHTSRGHKASKVCPDHKVMQPCHRCEQRLSRIHELMLADPDPNSKTGQTLNRLVELQMAAERNLMPQATSQVTVASNQETK